MFHLKIQLAEKKKKTTCLQDEFLMCVTVGCARNTRPWPKYKQNVLVPMVMTSDVILFF